MKRFLIASTFLAYVQLLTAAAPQGWFLAGSKPANYDTGIDLTAIYKGLPSSYLKAKADIDGFGTLMQSFSASQYLGKRVRLSGYIKTADVTKWAGLWARVDGAGERPEMLAFDNMQNRPIRGTTPWQRYEIVLDVPESASGIALGFLLTGDGQVWLSNTEFEIVDLSVPTTSIDTKRKIPEGPRNLSFIQ